MTKVCSKCGVEKDVSEYCKNKSAKDGLNYICRPCSKQKYKENKGRHKKCMAEWYIKNRDDVLEKSRNIDKNKKNRIARENYNPNKKKKYYEDNKRSILDRNQRTHKNRLKNDIEYYLKNKIRARIGRAIALQYTTKAYKSTALLGCTIQECREHLEKQFTESMTWDNHGRYGWHIDHIRPCASFDLTDPEQQKQCFHYTNLQPLWAKDNLRKSDKLDGI